MRILITNDDGINAEGLEVLTAIATEIAGPKGEVWTVAPAFEQSGVAHATSHAHPTMIVKLGDRRYAAEGSPADCVLAGVHDIMTDAPPDLVLSGVNRGNNSAENAAYSGTLGAAMEAALQGLPAIALSQYMGPRIINLANRFEASAAHGVAVVRSLLDKGLWDTEGYRLFYNVNFPPVPADEVLGVRVTAQGFRMAGAHRVEATTSPNGRRFLWISSSPQTMGTAPGTDAQANLDGYVSVTPMRADFTAHDVLDTLRERLE
ncbi:MAG: 5'/3'-nucleotidase SurE [Paracoccaceae bacterium]